MQRGGASCRVSGVALRCAGHRVTMNFFDLFRKPAARSGDRQAGARAGPASRALANAQSETLSLQAHAWVRQLPVTSRPLELCNVYPRIANRIARSWDDPASAETVLDDLIVDHRGGRKGFPSQIATELVRLYALHEKRLVDKSSQSR